MTNCPARTYTSTVSSSTPAAYPVYANSSTTAVYGASTYAAPTYSAPVYSASTPSVSLGTSYITTCIPTVITQVYTVTPTPSGVASSTGKITYANNAT